MKNVIKMSLLISILICYHSSKAQYQDSLTQNKKAIDSLLVDEHLESLDGSPKTFYSRGFEVRARALQKLVADCINFYQHNFPSHKFNVPLYVLDSKDWNEQLFGAPYSLPNYLPENNIIIIGAEKNALAKLTGQPTTTISDSIVSGYDYVAIHELGHYFFITLNNTRTHRKWMDEFVANYFMAAFIKEKRKTVYNQWQQMVDSNNTHTPPHRTLADFEKLYDRVGPANYDWYQKKFLELAFQLYPGFKSELITTVFENYAPSGKKTDALIFMKATAPAVMNKWLREMQ